MTIIQYISEMVKLNLEMAQIILYVFCQSNLTK